MKYSPDNITQLANNQVFVYGANEAYRHGAGAALYAKIHFGAQNGKSGLVGQSYGIPTKDKNLKVLSLSEIKKHIETFIDFAKKHPDLEFLVTAIGTGLSGLDAYDVALLFPYPLPENVLLPEHFANIIKSERIKKIYK